MYFGHIKSFFKRHDIHPKHHIWYLNINPFNKKITAIISDSKGETKVVQMEMPYDMVRKFKVPNGLEKLISGNSD